MSVRNLISLALVTVVIVLATAHTAFADSGVWTAVAEWTPARVMLGAAGVLFAAGLTRAQRD